MAPGCPCHAAPVTGGPASRLFRPDFSHTSAGVTLSRRPGPGSAFARPIRRERSLRVTESRLTAPWVDVWLSYGIPRRRAADRPLITCCIWTYGCSLGSGNREWQGQGDRLVRPLARLASWPWETRGLPAPLTSAWRRRSLSALGRCDGGPDMARWRAAVGLAVLLAATATVGANARSVRAGGPIFWTYPGSCNTLTL